MNSSVFILSFNTTINHGELPVSVAVSSKEEADLFVRNAKTAGWDCPGYKEVKVFDSKNDAISALVAAGYKLPINRDIELKKLEELKQLVFSWPEVSNQCANAEYHSIDKRKLTFNFSVTRIHFPAVLNKVKELGIGYHVRDSWTWTGHVYYTIYHFSLGSEVTHDEKEISKYCLYPQFPYSGSELLHRITGIDNGSIEEFGTYIILQVYQTTKKECIFSKNHILKQIKELVPHNSISVVISKEPHSHWVCEFKIFGIK
jgi:hypothetical protein